MQKIPLKSYFGKDYKFFWRNETTIGNWYGVFLNKVGMWLLKLARILLRKGGGIFNGKLYTNCSWCGEGYFKNGGLNHSVGRKGSRCMSVDSCDDKPMV